MAIPSFIQTELTKTPAAEVKPTGTAVESPVEAPATAATAEKPAPAVTETPKETPKEAPAFDFKSIDERLTSQEDIKNFLSERDKYATEVEDYKSKLSQYDGFIKPNSDFVSKLNEIEAKGGNVDLFLQMRNIDPQSLSEVDAVKLLMQYQDGLTSQDADRKVKILYKTGKDLKAIEQQISEARDATNVDKYDLKEASRLEEDMENILLAQGQLKADAKKAIQSLSELKVKSQEVPNIEKIQSEVRNSWTPHVGKFIPKDVSVPFKIENPDKSSTDLNVKYTLDSAAQKDLQEYLNGTVEYFTSQGIPYDENKAMQMLTEEVKYKVLGKNFDKIANQMVNTALEAERLRVKNAIHATPKAAEEVVNQGKDANPNATAFFNIIKGAKVGV